MKKAVAIAKLDGGRLVPVSAWDSELLASEKQGQEFDLVRRSKRTLPLHRTYWQALTKAVNATGRWHSREALHTALKVRMGMLEPIYDLKGNVTGMQPHSTAFSDMDQVEFKKYFDDSMAILSEAVGYDVLQFLHD